MLHNEGFIPRSHTLKKNELEKILHPEKQHIEHIAPGLFAIMMSGTGITLEYFIIMTAINSTTVADRISWIFASIFPIGILTIFALIFATAFICDTTNDINHNRIKPSVSVISKKDRRWTTLKSAFGKENNNTFFRLRTELFVTTSPSELSIRLDEILSDYMAITAPIIDLLEKPLEENAKTRGISALEEHAADTARNITELFNQHDNGDALRELAAKQKQEELIAKEAAENSFLLDQVIMQTRSLKA